MRGLLCDQGLCPVVHRGAAPGARRARGIQVTALCPGPTATEFFEVAAGQPDGGSPRWRPTRGGRRRRPRRPRRNKAVVRSPGVANKIGAQWQPLPAARGDAADHALLKRIQVSRPDRERRSRRLPRLLRAACRTASRGRSAPAAGSAPSGGRRTSRRRGSRPRRRTAGPAARRATPSRWHLEHEGDAEPLGGGVEDQLARIEMVDRRRLQVGQADRLAPVSRTRRAGRGGGRRWRSASCGRVA